MYTLYYNILRLFYYCLHLHINTFYEICIKNIKILKTKNKGRDSLNRTIYLKKKNYTEYKNSQS